MAAKITGAVAYNLLPTHNKKKMTSMKALYAVKCITFDRSEANSGDTLDVHVPKLNKNEVFVPGSLALHFDIDLSGGHANNFLVPERIACACEQDGNEVWGQDLGRHCGLQHIQDIHRPIFAGGKAWQHGS